MTETDQTGLTNDSSRNEALLALMRKSGYIMVQENGQRKYSPPPHWNGSPPPKGCEVRFFSCISLTCLSRILFSIACNDNLLGLYHWMYRFISSSHVTCTKVFVGKLPRHVFEDELVPLFEKAGPIYEMRLMMDFSGSNRGFGFVQYTNRDDARRSIALLDNYEIRRGKPQ